MPNNLKPGFFINGTFTTDSFGYKMTDRFIVNVKFYIPKTEYKRAKQ
ncbi:hypothetical protein [Chryseobacterium sp. 2VB]|nr:hypothetical protein [Chryseobacterium sp. 2VB]